MENDITITQEKKYLFCESRWTFWALTLAAGMYGAYTYNLRGGVFCNAQTANIVLFGMALGKADWKEAAYFLIPISAYLFGTIFSEILAKYVKRFQFLRWDTILVGFEMIVAFVIGCLPAISFVQCNLIHFDNLKVCLWLQPSVLITSDSLEVI